MVISSLHGAESSSGFSTLVELVYQRTTTQLRRGNPIGFTVPLPSDKVFEDTSGRTSASGHLRSRIFSTSYSSFALSASQLSSGSSAASKSSSSSTSIWLVGRLGCMTRGGYTEFTRAPLPSIHRKEASLIGQEVWLTGTCDPLCKNETTPIEDRRSGWRSSVAPEASRPDEVHVV
jgi:hypothetical protein